MKYLILLILLVFCRPSKAQLNLVPNPSFEDTVACPIYLDNMPDVQAWSSFGNSADYFNGCNNGSMSVPNAAFGYQPAHSGSAFCGVITYLKANHPNGNNYREFIGVQLSLPLQIGIRYYFSFYAVAGDKGSTGFLSNKLGLRFFTSQFSKLSPAPLDNFSNIQFDSILIDSISWHNLSGSFIADSNYQYVCIGNFYDYMHTDTITYLPFPYSAYYYIDDVCVTTDSLYNETWTGLHDVELNEIHIFPNPVKDYFQFKSNQLIDDILIYDSRGKLITSEKVNSQEGRINLKILSEGIYFASFRKEKTISVYKLLKL